MRLVKKPLLLFLLIILTVVTACARLVSKKTPPAALTQIASTEETLISNATTRHYRLYIPSGYRAGSTTALVVNFHGLNSNSNEQEALSGLSLKAEKESFIAVYPDARNQQWDVGNGAEGKLDQQFIIDLVQVLQTRYTIDAKRIYATGISNGGGMTNRVGCELADLFAAIAPVAGAYNYWQDCHPSRPMPVIAFHGTADNIVPYEGVGNGMMLPPIRDWAAGWVERNHCDAAPALTYSKPDVKGETWDNCQLGAQVILYTIKKQGHSWPGGRLLPKITSQAINATDVMWEFFVSHPMP